jgi:hypothetical protein
MHPALKTVLSAIGSLTLGIALLGCGASPPAGPSVASPAAEMHPEMDPEAVPGDPAPGMLKVSANSSTEDEIAAALQAAGVPSPQRWAAEVVEYRPYPLDDLTLAKLRQNLAKYNPSQQTLDKIVAALQP